MNTKDKIWQRLSTEGWVDKLSSINLIDKAIDLTMDEVSHKHQVSMQCARDASAETETERVLKEGDSFFIGKQYGEDDLTNDEYDKLVKLWEEFKLNIVKE